MWGSLLFERLQCFKTTFYYVHCVVFAIFKCPQQVYTTVVLVRME